MSLSLAKCPKCGSSRQVIRVTKHDVYENFPDYSDDNTQGDVSTVSTMDAFFCPDCNWEFTSEGQTFNESLMLVKR